MKLAIVLGLSASGMAAGLASAAEISTHVLDLAEGIGGRDVPVVLLKKAEGGQWVEQGKTKTDENGRVRSFGTGKSYSTGIYKLQFDMTKYPTTQSAPFFPEIDLVFAVTDSAAHYHVPVVVSPFGYSTYRGN